MKIKPKPDFSTGVACPCTVRPYNRKIFSYLVPTYLSGIKMKRMLLSGLAVLLILSVSAVSTVQASLCTVGLLGLEWNHDPLKVFIKAQSASQVSEVQTALRARNDDVLPGKDHNDSI